MMEYDEFPAMSTTIQVAAEGESVDLMAGFANLHHYVVGCEQRFSRFRQDSELSALNRSSGSWFAASMELFDLVQTAVELYELTDGLFDPSILPALINAGYDRSLDEIRKRDPLVGEPNYLWSGSHFHEIDLDPDTKSIFLPSGMMLDLGGIAKGWIAERAVELLSQYCEACAVSAGGDFALAGLPRGEADWKISLEDPRDPDQILSVLRIPPGGLATSSITRRNWIKGGQPRHHIIDPRSGMPAETAWLSVTVWAQNTSLAEAFAKGLLIADPEEAPGIAARVPELLFIAVAPDGSLFGSHQSREMILHVTEPIS